MQPLNPETKKTLLAVAITAVVCLLGGAGLGWGLKPDVVKIEERIKVVEVTKEVVVVQEKVRVEVVKVKDTQVVERWHREKKTFPDGTITEVEDKNIDSIVNEKENTVEVKIVEVTKEVVVEKLVDRVIKIDPVLAQWRVGATGGAQFLFSEFPMPTPVFGVEAERRLAGPFWIGLGGSLNTKLNVADIRLKVAVEF